MRPDYAVHRKIGDRRIHVGEPAGVDPRRLDDDVRQIDGDELRDFRLAVVAGNQFQIDLRRRKHSTPAPLVGHAGNRERRSASRR
jgi:hypothetical protein